MSCELVCVHDPPTGRISAAYDRQGGQLKCLRLAPQIQNRWCVGEFIEQFRPPSGLGMDEVIAVVQEPVEIPPNGRFVRMANGMLRRLVQAAVPQLASCQRHDGFGTAVLLEKCSQRRRTEPSFGQDEPRLRGEFRRFSHRMKPVETRSLRCGKEKGPASRRGCRPSTCSGQRGLRTASSTWMSLVACMTSP